MSGLFDTLITSARKDGIDSALQCLKNKPNLARELVVNIKSVGFNEFCRTAADAIAVNLLIWYDRARLATINVVKQNTLEQIAHFLQRSDESAMVAMSLLVHVSKANLLLLVEWTQLLNNPNSFSLVEQTDAAHMPDADTLTKALDLLKSNLFAAKLAEIASECTGASIGSIDVVNLINSCQIRFVRLSDTRLRGWPTATGVAINSEAVSKEKSHELENPIALCCLIGHELQHFINRHLLDDLNSSTPELISSNHLVDINQSSQESKSSFHLLNKLREVTGKGHCEAGLFFELAVFGEKLDFSKPSDQLREHTDQLLEILKERVATTSSLPLLNQADIDSFMFLKVQYNAEFAFDFVSPRIYE